ncbi:reticulon-4-interacting protein 1 homolog, mitochondrial [Scaptodrosophila lebanonensis]|uniref:Reticulon-4-interacting protein 1 homolog, mitochondrial n=1 Tax=Drosophila lebanonensis TaxID=7225 RepID=A0A6J2U359_DROLE|nr:reticulon-4-interacting protein 1 homolog, mitochondrial [Scaptodrosophila lebanonensis]
MKATSVCKMRPINWLGTLLRSPRSSGRYVGSRTTTTAATGVQRTPPPPPKASTKMRGWQLHCYGDIDELQLSEKLRMPQIRSSNDCLVRVRTTTINPIDLAMLRGYGATVLNTIRCQPGEGIEFPLTLGREFCGELVQKGMGVNSEKLALGQRVWGVVPLQISGSHADYVVVPSYCLAPAPTELDDSEAASVLYAGLTAWSGLYITGRLGGLCGATTSSGGGANKRVLVFGGSGGVGTLAIQMLKSQGVQVLATCSENAVEMVRCLGADHVVDYNNPADMDTLCNYAPYDIVLDCAGQGSQQAAQLKFDFRQYITFSSPLLANIDKQGLGLGLLKNVADLLESNAKAITQRGGLVKWGFFAPASHGIEFLQSLVQHKKLIPLIDSSFEFAELPKAFERLKCGHLRGKVVVKL